MATSPGNAHTAASPPTAELRRYCLALEELRRTPEGRVRNSEELVASFFPHDGDIVADQLFRYMPNETRAGIISGWKIRGPKAALRDDDAKVEEVVHDALLAGDLDATAFESGVTAEILIQSVPLTEWWIFWRTGKLSAAILVRALLIARDQKLLAASWFLENVSGDGEAHGIDVFAPKLSKDDLATWVRQIAATGNATSEGVVNALGWEKILATLSVSSLLLLMDGLIRRIGLSLDLPADLANETDVERTVVQTWSERKQLRKDEAK
ncbi:MAG: hypothetical protein ABI461_20960 [Polyangiaceae bacterium]